MKTCILLCCFAFVNGKEKDYQPPKPREEAPTVYPVNVDCHKSGQCCETGREVGQAVKVSIENMGEMQNQEQSSTLQLAAAADAAEQTNRARSVQEAMRKEEMARQKAETKKANLISKLEDDKDEELQDVLKVDKVEEEKKKVVKKRVEKADKAVEQVFHILEDEDEEEEILQEVETKEDEEKKLVDKKIKEVENLISKEKSPSPQTDARLRDYKDILDLEVSASEMDKNRAEGFLEEFMKNHNVAEGRAIGAEPDTKNDIGSDLKDQGDGEIETKEDIKESTTLDEAENKSEEDEDEEDAGEGGDEEILERLTGDGEGHWSESESEPRQPAEKNYSRVRNNEMNQRYDNPVDSELLGHQNQYIQKLRRKGMNQNTLRGTSAF